MGALFLQDLWFHQVEDVEVESAVSEGGLVTVRARKGVEQAACPACGTLSSRIHSRYVRRLADSAVGGRRVLIELQVRRFRCRERACRQATFAEQVDGLIFRHGRRSASLQKVLECLAVMLAGRAGARFSKVLTTQVSKSTLLRMIRRLPEPEPTTPRVLGTDEFALRKGPNYGPILIDIETRQPIDLLRDRTPTKVARWLTDHPGVEAICRDRSTARPLDRFRRGRTDWRPPAVHVAGRWRIWSNLAEAVEKSVVRHRALPRKPHDSAATSISVAMKTKELEPHFAPEPRTAGRLFDRMREQHAAVHAFLGRGVGLRAIGRGLGLARNTVRCLAHAASPDERLVWPVDWPHQHPRLLQTHLYQRWADGCTVARHLFEEIRARGYTGGESFVKEYVNRLREVVSLCGFL